MTNVVHAWCLNYSGFRRIVKFVGVDVVKSTRREDQGLKPEESED